MNFLKAKQERLLETFALAYRADKDQLVKYCVDYPDYASDFIGLAHEIALQSSLSTDAPLSSEDEAWIAEACSARKAPTKDVFSLVPARKYAGIREALGVPGVVINAFRDRLVAVATVPMTFLEDLADELGSTVLAVVRYLEGPPKISLATSHKSDDAPEASKEKMSFNQILEDAGVPSERRRKLLGSD